MNTVDQSGTKSRVRRATKADMSNIEFSGSLLIAVYDYVSMARDHTASPTKAFDYIERAITNGDKHSMLLVHATDFTVHGFMYCKLDETNPTVAVINQALHAPVTPIDVINTALGMFEEWANQMGCKSAKFHTFRVPGAHKLMSSRGWNHTLTTYTKEL